VTKELNTLLMCTLHPQARGRSSWNASITCAARHRFEISLSVQRGRKKEKQGTHFLPLSTYNALGALRQDPGRAAESPAEASTCGNQGFAK
jgi:hypothetical protein